MKAAKIVTKRIRDLISKFMTAEKILKQILLGIV